MTLQEFYQKLGGDYEEVLQRLTKEERIERFVLRFLTDDSYELLCDAMAVENYEEVFRAVHTLKGVCLNLGFSKLLVASAAMTEAVRGGKPLEDKSLFDAVKAEYERTIEVISAFQRCTSNQL